MEFRILGPLEGTDKGRSLPLGAQKQRAVLAVLLLNQGEVVSTDRLVDELWGEQPPPTAVKSLQVYVSQLRKVLGNGVLETRGRGYLVRLAADQLDAQRFEELLEEGRELFAAGDAGGAGAVLRDALGLWRGPPLSDFAYEPFAQPEIARLEELRLAALETRIDVDVALGRHRELVSELEALTRQHPLRERLRAQLMLALYRSGRQADALAGYKHARTAFVDELGIEPSRELQELEQAILRQDPDLDAPAVSGKALVDTRVWAGRTIALGGALVLGAAILAAVIAFARADSDAGILSAIPNSVAAIDPESGKIVAEIPLGAAPGEVAAGPGAVWVTNSNDNSVSRIDPSTSDIRQTIQVGDGPAGVAVGGGAVWVANGLNGTVSRIDPAANRVVQTIRVGNGPSGVAYGEQAVWVTNSADGTVSEIDPDTGDVRRTLPAVIGASGIAVGFGRVWIASSPSGSMVALDPRSGRVLQRIGVGVNPEAVAAGAGAVWVANRSDGTVSKFDPRADAVTATIPVGRGPAGIAAGPQGVWVANAADMTLARIDPSTAAVKTIRLDNPPRDVALSPQGVFVAVRSTGSEHRGGTLRVLPPFSVDSIDLALTTPDVWSVLTMTNDGLVGFRRVGGVQGAQLVPDLAVSLPTPTDSGKTYTFRVRPDIRYSNGKFVQADDFRRALARVFEVGGFEAVYFGGIRGADRCAKGRSCDLSRGIVTDRAARTVTFHLTAPDADFLAKLALPPAFAIPAGTPAHDVGTQPIPATGPYRIAEYRKATKTLRLVRNRSFREWSADAQPQGYPNSISWSWRFGLDTSARVRAVQRGNADIALAGPPLLSKPQLDVLAVRYPNQLHVGAGLGTTYFFLNTLVPPFDDVRVRRAINEAFDREALTLLLGRAFAPTCQILPPNFPGYRPKCPYAAGGVTGVNKARRLVRASGTAGTRVTVWMPSPLAEQGRYMVSLLNSLGYRARLEAMDPDVYFTTISDSRARAQTGYYGWSAAYPSAADFIPPQLSCAAFVPASPERNSNFSGFCDPSIDAQMTRAAAIQVQDPAAATVLWQQVEQSLLAQAPVVPAYNTRKVDFVSERVGNYQYNPQWGLLLDQAWVK